MRRLLALLLAAVAMAAGAASASRSASTRLVADRGPTVVLPPGWHLVRRSLTPVRDPTIVMAAATFRVRPAGHLCDCGFPNLRDFPAGGAFVYVWEYLTDPNLRRIPPRPRHFSLAGARGTRDMCEQTSDTFAFRAGGHAYQVEVDFGPRAGPGRLAQITGLLDSLRSS